MEVLLVKKTFKLIGTGLLLLVFGSANAHYMVVDGEFIPTNDNFQLQYGVPGTIGLDGNNEVLEGGTLDGWFGSKLFVYGPMKMRIDLIGFETENPVQFHKSITFFDTERERFASYDSLGTLSSPIDRSGGSQFGPFGGYLEFGFTVTTDEGTFTATNENNFDSASRPNIFMSIEDDPMGKYGNSVLLAFDENIDGDYDDMFVRLIDVSIPTVPEPATLWLFGISLAGLGILRKRMMR